jgi:hypothetical protein
VHYLAIQIERLNNRIKKWNCREGRGPQQLNGVYTAKRSLSILVWATFPKQNSEYARQIGLTCHANLPRLSHQVFCWCQNSAFPRPSWRFQLRALGILRQLIQPLVEPCDVPVFGEPLEPVTHVRSRVVLLCGDVGWRTPPVA